MNRIVLHVDRLVLKGFHADARDGMAAALQADLQAELGRLLAEPGALAQLSAAGSSQRLAAPREPGTHVPVSAGTAAARAIVRGAPR
ncbi:hypothetical protein [Pseudorhodoferax sp. Leaf267]|uniref:hypothetical protein n=1 Tax=Pseudorhodoferax sp. Leaf267 TaxID=1736316 RepID=UPI0006FA851D|nr:hypothetical protein [Pseudorhodoferax sp. Leaf267]KQP12277.1 hypothetical protein ASF43_22495 [Pseudorhodoferax sp. Leaf267]